VTLARAWSVALAGVRGHLVEVESDLAAGLPSFTLTGLPDASVSESRDRVRAAVVNSGEPWPGRRITIGLSPATLPKAGSGFDIAIALTVLAADGSLSADRVSRLVAIGELGLDGQLRHVRGVLPAVAAAVAAGHCDVVVPLADAHEAALVPGARVHPAEHLTQLVAWLRGSSPLPAPPAVTPPADDGRTVDLCDVAGHPEGRLALEVAAAGGHHMLMVGPPGCGKTMLAERLPGILPPLDRQQQLEVTAVHSIAGALPEHRGLVTKPPFQAPHHSASVPALVGGGSGLARPGAISLAHHGVLFLDEAPEFRTGVLDALRQPLESGRVEIARAKGTSIFPARATLVLAANPCRCASVTGSSKDCSCPPGQRARYLDRLSGPFMDRVDIKVELQAVSRFALGEGEPTATVAARVLGARRVQAIRFAGTPWRTTSEVPGPELRRRWPVPPAATRRISQALEVGSLSARGADRVLRVAWTLADLDGADQPSAKHVDEAVYLRTAA
jgi:magnesium chelatase family protein